MLEGRDYCAFGIVFSIVCCFNDRVSRYKNSAEMTRVHIMYSSLVSRVTSGYCKQGCQRKEVKDAGLGDV